MDPLIIVVLGLLAIAAASIFSARLGIAAPLLLVVTGIGVSFLPFVPAFEIEPEWILGGVLPPLLYSASASMPATRFQRDVTAIGSLSVVLVVLSAVVLGLFFAWLVPGLALGWGIALGAIISPTDAVATTIVRRLGVSRRVVAILEGESLLNDATALVLLRAAIAGAGASVSLWGVAATFVYSVIAAAVIGLIAGHLVLWLRARVDDPAVNTLISFTTPFLAAIPTSELGASGLVAAVMAGLVTGRHAPEVLSVRHRLSDLQNWRMVELVLEGAIFLVMGLQVSGIVGDVQADHAGIGRAVALAAGALVVTVAVRTAFVAPLLAALRGRAARGESFRPWLVSAQDRLETGDTSAFQRFSFRSRPPNLTSAAIDRLRDRIRRGLASIDYFLAEPLRWPEGVIVVWAGMRGAVTLAAAQTLPADTPQRSLLVLVAFLVATGSLFVQGLSLPWVIARVRPAAPDPVAEHEEQRRITALLHVTAETVGREADEREDGRRITSGPDTDAERRRALTTITAQRAALLDARDDGTFSEQGLADALTTLDIEQIRLELSAEPIGGA